MEKQSTCVMLILAFLQTGRSNNRIIISQRQAHTALIVTCNLTGEDRISQINWERMNGSSHAVVGIVHPQHGTHILQEYTDSIEIEKSSHFRSTSLILNEVYENNGTRYCCIFITFPSGNLPSCLEVTTTTASAPVHQERFQVQAEPFLLGIFIIPIIILIAVAFLSWQHFCSRRQVLELQHRSQSDGQEIFEESAGATSQLLTENELPEGFDPSNLYTKIKIDRYYEKLWKTCQVARCGLSTLAQSGTHKIYYLRGEHEPSQKDQEGESLPI